MPYNQPKTANYFGFQPVLDQGSAIPLSPYLVSSSEGAIYAGDAVVQTSLNTVKSVTGAFSPTSSAGLVGVAAQFLAANGGSTAAQLNLNTSQLLLVYDDPMQVFMTCDTTSGVIGPQTGLFKNYAILASGATGSTGPNTTLNRSVMAIGGVQSSVVGGFHVIGLHPLEQGVYSTAAAGTASAGTEVRKWLGRLVTPVTMGSTQLNAIANTTS